MEPTADRFLAYLNKSSSPYHAVTETAALLKAAGFCELHEATAWTLEPEKAYFVVRGGKTIVAWRQGTAAPAQAGFRIVVAHTDSPVLKLRARPDLVVRNMRYLTTEIYGGPLLYTWLDRDLKISGALYCGEQNIQRVLVDLDHLPVRAVSLAIHLRSDKGSDTYTFDREKDFGIAIGQGEKTGLDLLREAAIQQLGTDPGPILSFDLLLAPLDPARRIGPAGELISGPRLDNLFSCYTGLAALLEDTSPASWTRIVALYDSEEIGSQTWTGARGDTVEGIVQRIVSGGPEEIWRAKARSIVVSADMAHGEHPAFAAATDPTHVPELNKGLAVKNGAMGNYAIGPGAEAWFELICRKANVPLQRFRYRCDHGRGSSIGPIMTTGLGITGIDVGAPMLAMHSARELAGAADLDLSIAAFKAFYSAEDALPLA